MKPLGLKAEASSRTENNFHSFRPANGGGDLCEGLKGDVIISVDAARSNAAVFKTSLEYELVLYVIHGILHLLGFDDHDPVDIQRMRRKEKEFMEHFKNRIQNVVREK